MENELTVYQTVIDEIREIICQGTMNAYQAINTAQVLTYWNIGRQIVEEEQHGENRAEYGIRLIEAVAEQLTKEFGASYSKRNLQYYRKFYLCFPDPEIVNACVHNLSWTHFRSLLRVDDPSELKVGEEGKNNHHGAL